MGSRQSDAQEGGTLTDTSQIAFEPVELIEVADPKLMDLINDEEIRKIRYALSDQERSFGELKKTLGIKEDTLKLHLFSLINNGFVIQTKKGDSTANDENFSLYRIAAKHFVYVQAPEMVVSDPVIISHLAHERKKILMDCLKSDHKTIMDLHRESGLNPGTVKRHLDELLDAGLVIYSREEFNERRILLKYYIAAARKIVFHYEWPDNS